MAQAGNHRGSSKQNYATPPEFLAAVVGRFGPLSFDLAADAENTKVPAPHYFTEAQDSLRQHWHLIGGLLWLNPPFGNIAPWARKCRAEAEKGARIAFLVPASVGSNWYRDNIHDRHRVIFLNGRIVFDGKNGFPKDCMLVLFGDEPGFEVWSWKAP
jgi:phage N-6-adenine-methyltransferase